MRILIVLAAMALAMAQPARSDEGVADAIKETAQPLLKALSLLGTPYRRGGVDPEKGVDCSGLVKRVYKDGANVDLPRTAREMSREGEKVAREELKPGDLVFFGKGKKTVSHVGIYAGNGDFVHASSQKHKEVMVSSLEEGYWAKRFRSARRVLFASEASTASDIK